MEKQEEKTKQRISEDLYRFIDHYLSRPENKKAKNFFLRELIHQIVFSLDYQEKKEKLKKLFKQACSNKDDNAAIAILNILNSIAEITEKQKEFIDWLMEIYWQIPEKEYVSIPISPDAFLKTRSYILQNIATNWYPFNSDIKREQANKAFRFLIAAHTPQFIPKNSRAYQCPYGFDKKSEGHACSKKIKKKIEELIRERDLFFDLKKLEKWIYEPGLPQEIAETLAIARVKKGSWKKDLVNTEITDAFDTTQWSKGAQIYYGKQGEALNRIDALMQKLIYQDMINDFVHNIKKIGKSNYVLGEKIFNYELTKIILVINLDKKEISKELFEDNFKRAVKHLKKFIQEQKQNLKPIFQEIELYMHYKQIMHLNQSFKL